MTNNVLNNEMPNFLLTFHQKNDLGLPIPSITFELTFNFLS